MRKVVLAAYKLVPEAYRQKFRSLRRKGDETFLDLASRQEALFDRWLASNEVFFFQDLRELMLMEQFKRSIPLYIDTHLNDLEVKGLRKAAIMADSYELTHRDLPGKRRSCRPERPVGEETRVPMRPAPGHIKSACPVLRNKEAN